jgi:hypothetical protein
VHVIPVSQGAREGSGPGSALFPSSADWLRGNGPGGGQVGHRQ